jgi:predicted ATPase
MLKRFRVSNFKNLLNVEFRPVGVNLLIGPNNAGKTNLCNALRFFCGTSIGTLDESATFTLGESWNITNVNVSQKVMEMEADVDLTVSDECYSFNYVLKLSADRDQAVWKQPLKVIEEKLVVTGEAFHNHMLIENRSGAAKLTNEKASLNPGSNGRTVIESQVPPECTALSKIYDMEVNRLAMLFKRFLGNCVYFALEPRALRNPKVVAKTPYPSSSGDNFSKFLFTVHNENPRLERKVIEALRVLEPKLDLLTFYNPDPDFIHFIMEDKLCYAAR